MLTRNERFDNLDNLRKEGLLIRNIWTGTDATGRATACLLAAISPEAGISRDSSSCPADVISPWFAHLTPWIDDAGSSEKWSGVVARYAAIVRQWHKLTPEADRCLEYSVRAACVREAMLHTTNKEALSVCQTVVDLCKGVAKGSPIDREAFDWAEARAAASASASAAAAAAGAAWEAWAAEAAARAAAGAAGAAAGAAGAAGAEAAAASWAAESWAAGAGAAWEAGAAARAAAASWAADRLTDKILTLCEKALGIVR